MKVIRAVFFSLVILLSLLSFVFCEGICKHTDCSDCGTGGQCGGNVCANCTDPDCCTPCRKLNGDYCDNSAGQCDMLTDSNGQPCAAFVIHKSFGQSRGLPGPGSSNDDTFSISQYLFGNSSSNKSSQMLIFGYCKFCKNLTLETIVSQPTVVAAIGNTMIDLCQDNAGGYLCNECINDTYHNRHGQCVSCENIGLNWLYFILLELLPIVIFFLFLYISELNLASGGFNSTIFFAQMITTAADITANGFIPISNITKDPSLSRYLIDIYYYLYNFWNLEFFSPLTYDLCLFHKQSFLYYFLVEYGIVLYCLVILIIGVAIKKALMRINCMQRHCNLNGLSLLMSTLVLLYTKLAVTSTMLVTPVPIHNVSGEEVDRVSLYDPKVKFFGAHYIAAVVIGIVILSLLFIYPTLVLVQVCLMKNKVNDRFTFVNCFNYLAGPFKLIVKDLHNNEQLNNSHPHPRPPHPGPPNPHPPSPPHPHLSEEWIAAGFFFLRLLILISYSIPIPYIQKYLFQQAFLIIGATIIVIFQPYRKHPWMNSFDVSVILLLVFINSMSIYQYSLTQSSQDLSLFVFVIQYVLLYFPGIWMFGYVLGFLYKKIKTKFQHICTPTTVTTNEDSDQENYDERGHKDSLLTTGTGRRNGASSGVERDGRAIEMSQSNSYGSVNYRNGNRRK